MKLGWFVKVDLWIRNIVELDQRSRSSGCSKVRHLYLRSPWFDWDETWWVFTDWPLNTKYSWSWRKFKVIRFKGQVSISSRLLKHWKKDEDPWSDWFETWWWCGYIVFWKMNGLAKRGPIIQPVNSLFNVSCRPIVKSRSPLILIMSRRSRVRLLV